MAYVAVSRLTKLVQMRSPLRYITVTSSLLTTTSIRSRALLCSPFGKTNSNIAYRLFLSTSVSKSADIPPGLVYPAPFDSILLDFPKFYRQTPSFESSSSSQHPLLTKTQFHSLLSTLVKSHVAAGKTNTIWIRPPSLPVSAAQEELDKAKQILTTADIIDVACGRSEFGFRFHHAEGSSNSSSSSSSPNDDDGTGGGGGGGINILLMKWLQPQIKCKVPPYATHQVGVAGVVIDNAGRVLLIQERKKSSSIAAASAVVSTSPSAASSSKTTSPIPSAPLQHTINNNLWKFPGGLADKGEHFGETAVREVFEETGVKTRFKSLLAFRHSHKASFGVSDIYLLALLRPIDDVKSGFRKSTVPSIQEDPSLIKTTTTTTTEDTTTTTTIPLNLDPDEIAAGKWMDAIDYANTATHPLNRHVARLAAFELQQEKNGSGNSNRGGNSTWSGSLQEEISSSSSITTTSSNSILEEDLWIPLTKKWTKVYGSAAAPRIEPAVDSPIQKV